MVVSEVFRDAVPDVPLAGPVMLLEGLQARIVGQLAVLDDAELTGTGLSSADVLGVPGTVLADKLAGHLVREIIVRGSGGGPLTPLADQLNHELTRLQIGGLFARLAAEIRDALAGPDSDVTVAAWPLDEVTDPFALEVHRPVQSEDAPSGLPVLPAYVPREHDEALGKVVRRGGGRPQRDRGAGGRVVDGQDAGVLGGAGAAAGAGPGRGGCGIRSTRPARRRRCGSCRLIGPRTVVWLNEAQFYLDVAAGGLGERVAAGLRELLRDPAGARCWCWPRCGPSSGTRLTVRPAGGRGSARPGPGAAGGPGHHRARRVHRRPAATSWPRRGTRGWPRPPRRREDGQVIQFLAGAPELMARYRNAPPAAAALISAAIDARRLGMGIALPLAFLEAAAPGYLTDTDWDGLGEDWLEQALAYTAAPCKGIRGPLTRIRPRTTGTSPASVQAYRLADYLEQHGRRARRRDIPPAGFWTAAARFADPGDLPALASGRRGPRPAAGTRPACASTPPPRETPVRQSHFVQRCALSAPAATRSGAVGRRTRRPRQPVRGHPAAGRAAARRVRTSRPPCWPPAPPPAPTSTTPPPSSGCCDQLRKADADEQAAVLAGRAAAGANLDDPARRRPPAGCAAHGGRRPAGRSADRPRSRRARQPRQLRSPSPICCMRCARRAQTSRSAC